MFFKVLVGKKSVEEIDLSQMAPQDVVNEIFNSTLIEIMNEVNIPREALSDPVLIGVARNTTSAGRPSSEYYVRSESKDTLSLIWPLVLAK